MAQQDREQGVPSATRVFYRLVKSDAPSVDEFKSYHALGKEPPKSKRDDPDFLRRWKGLSVYDSYRAARDLAELKEWKRWAYIAELHIPDDASIVYEGPEDYGHWNLYDADPVYLADSCVVRVLHAPDVESVT